MSPAKHSFGKCDRQKCDRRTDKQTDGWTDDGQSDPYVSLCFAGDTKIIVCYHKTGMIHFLDMNVEINN